jgi:hypothetical protein
MNSLYIVTGIDTDTKDKFEYEEFTLQKAMEIYNSLKDESDISGLVILEYNLSEKRYHIIEV